jgi:hypothetical protein
MSTQPYPVRLIDTDDLGRSRLTVFFRIILVIPHALVLMVYGIGAYLAVIVAWFAALFTGRVPDGVHAFISGYLRYYTRVVAYLSILSDPYPPFGSGGTYPVDLEIDPAVPQSRLTVFFRGILVLPCYILVAYGLQPLLGLVSIACWFVALFTGRVPAGLEKLGLFCLRFNLRTLAYWMLANPRYPAFGEEHVTLPGDQVALPPVP